MSCDPFIASVLRRSDSLLLPENLHYAEDFVGAGGKVHSQPSGHAVFLGSTGRRILMTDPEGHPLHECAWEQNDQGQDRLVSARVRLDWQQWIGIRPEKLVYETCLNLSTRPGWETITKDDLRMMAARAMNVSLEQIQFFYRDQDIIIEPSGKATIRQRKDAFYILQDGRFNKTTFMSCMTAMHWERIDYLPVVELFLSLLPGTGSATFELIRGLYDDQNPHEPVPLHYRGLPPYPSEGAFQLFSQFFTPSTKTGADPLRVFLDASHAEELRWLPSTHYPLRYCDPANHLGVTVTQGKVVKATRSNDPAGLSFFAPRGRGLPPCARSVTATQQQLILQDEDRQIPLPTKPSWGITDFGAPASFPPSIPSWRSLFPQGVPAVSALEAFSAVLLYPEDRQVIGERECQPFVFDYIEDLSETTPRLQSSLQSARRILICGCEAALKACVHLNASQDYTVLYTWEDLAQKQAQAVWNQCARAERWNELRNIRFLPYQLNRPAIFQECFDLIYYWIPFHELNQPALLEETLTSLVNMLPAGGVAIVPGVPRLHAYAQQHHIAVLHAEYVQNLPTFRLHQAILPQSELYEDLMAFVLQK